LRTFLPTKYTQGGLDFVESYLPYSTPSLNWWGASGFTVGQINQNKKEIFNFFEQTFKEIK